MGNLRHRPKSGTNRRVNRRVSSKQSGGAFGYIVALIVLGGLVTAVFTVPIQGKTVASRVGQTFGTEAAKIGSGFKSLIELQSSSKTAAQVQGAKPVDKLTESDKRELNSLIEKKMHQ